MDFVTVRELRLNTGEIWKTLAKERDLIVTSKGKPIAILTDVTGPNLEDILSAIRAERGRQALRKIRRKAQDRGTSGMTIREIDEEIRLARRERNK